MPGERTVLRIFLDANGRFNSNLMVDGLSVADMHLLLAALSVHHVGIALHLNGVHRQQLTPEDVDKIRNLLDNREGT